MFSPLLRLPLATKVTLLSLGVLILFAATTFLVTMNTLSGDAAQRAANRQQTNMSVAWQVLEGYGSRFALEGETLTLDGRALNGFNEPVDKIKQLVGGTATIFAADTRVATNVTKEDGTRAVGTKLAPGATYDAVLRDGRPYRGEADILGHRYYTAYDPIRDAAGKVIGVLYVGIPASEISAGISELQARLLIATAIALLVIGAVLFFACRRMFAPLSRIREAMDMLAAGRNDIDIPARGRADEIGRMANALVVFREAAEARKVAEAQIRRNQRAVEQVVATLNISLTNLSNGVLSRDINADFPAEYATLKDNLNVALDGLRDLIGSVRDASVAIRSGSQEIADASEDLARRSESNAASLEQTTAAVNQINDRVSGIAQAARDTVTRAGDAAAVVDSGRATADQAVRAMGRVAECAQGIDSVIEGLDKIAFQTRVLAMNAAVEAGRAGEAGRGFAVVADLVSALAMRAEEEAKRARDQLTMTQAEVSSAVEAVQGVDQALVRIVENVGSVSTLLGIMAEDNDAQSAAVGEITAAITTMDRATQQNAAMVEQTSAAARNLLTQVDGLTERTARFQLDEGAMRPALTMRRPNNLAALPGSSHSPSRLPVAAVSALRAPSTDGDWESF